jgi:hypothetical protein
VKTYRTIHNKKQGVIIRDKEKGTCRVTDTGMWGDRNITKKVAENIFKYKYLGYKQSAWTSDSMGKWNHRKIIHKVLSNILGQQLQKAAIVFSGHILQNTVMWNYKTFINGGKNKFHVPFNMACAALLTANPPLQQDNIPHAVICSLTILMMGKYLSETCWADLEDQ